LIKKWACKSQGRKLRRRWQYDGNIDKVAGEGTGAFAKQGVDIYLTRLK